MMTSTCRDALHLPRTPSRFLVTACNAVRSPCSRSAYGTMRTALSRPTAIAAFRKVIEFVNRGLG